jgi:hypothetical protein
MTSAGGEEDYDETSVMVQPTSTTTQSNTETESGSEESFIGSNLFYIIIGAIVALLIAFLLFKYNKSFSERLCSSKPSATGVTAPTAANTSATATKM